jgi:RNA polymerase sigma factor (sigma-70 family)
VNADEPLPTRASLLARLKDAHDAPSWDEFHSTYKGLLTGVARRAGLTEIETEELVQETMIAVSRKMPEFRYEPGKDSFKGWLLQIARWKIADQFRKRRPYHAPENKTETDSNPLPSPSRPRLPNDVPDAAADIDRIWEAEWQRHLLEQALTRVKRQVNPAHYAIYHLQVIEERPVAEVRRLLGVTAAHVYLARHRVGRALKKQLKLLRHSQE